jgi:hypothetical protein
MTFEEFWDMMMADCKSEHEAALLMSRRDKMQKSWEQIGSYDPLDHGPEEDNRQTPN